MMKKTKIIILLCLWIMLLSINAQEVIDLYKGEIPNSKNISVTEVNDNGIIHNVVTPTLEVFLPSAEKATGSGVIICPGGGYAVVVYEAEGVRTAEEFTKNGIAAFVLKYRIPADSTMKDKTIGPLQDAQQAIKIVRDNASTWGVDPGKVGVMGFSAGGHLASTLSTHFEETLIENSSDTNLRPDFQILVYPVISMQDSLTHAGSKECLLGKNPPEELVNKFSNELQVKDNTPPAYITHAGDDTVVDVDNSIFYYEALRHHKVPVEMHIYPAGNHGFVLKQPVEEWMAPLLKWIVSFK